MAGCDQIVTDGLGSSRVTIHADVRPLREVLGIDEPARAAAKADAAVRIEPGARRAVARLAVNAQRQAGRLGPAIARGSCMASKAAFLQFAEMGRVVQRGLAAVRSLLGEQARYLSRAESPKNLVRLSVRIAG